MEEQNDDFFLKIKEKLNIDVPQYIRNVLYISGYDNALSLSGFSGTDIIKIESFMKSDVQETLIPSTERPNLFNIFSSDTQNFRILPGHKKLLLLLGNTLTKKHFETLAQSDAIQFNNTVFEEIYVKNYISIPTYLQNLLIINGFDTNVSLCNISDEDITEMEEFARGVMRDYIEPDEMKNFYGWFLDKKEKFQILEGHKKLLMSLKAILECKEPPRKKPRLETSPPGENELIASCITTINSNLEASKKTIRLTTEKVKIQQTEPITATIECCHLGCSTNVKIQFISNRWIHSNYFRHLNICNKSSISKDISEKKQKQIHNFFGGTSKNSQNKL